MKRIKIMKMRLENFKGIKETTIDFGYRTDICGANATGKTTIFDAFTWALFGKDSQDRTDSGRGAFGIKATDGDGNVIGKMDHGVELTIDVDGVETTLKRAMAEKWVTKNGTGEVEFKGNETKCYWNGVEMKISDYSRRIADDLIDDNRFKALTNPHYVCEMPWEKQKALLAELIGNVTFEDIVGDNAEFQAELDVLKAKNQVGREDEYLKSVQSGIRKAKDDIKAYTQQVTGMKGMIPERPDTKELSKRRDILDKELAEIDARQKVVSDKERERYNAIKKIEARIENINIEKVNYKLGIVKERQEAYKKSNEAYYKAVDELATIKAESVRVINGLKQNTYTLSNMRVDVESKVKYMQASREDLLTKWNAENDKVFDGGNNGELICPLTNKPCGSLETKVAIHNDRAKAEREFNETKDAKLTAIEEKGKALKVDLEKEVAHLADIDKNIREHKDILLNAQKEWDAKISAARMREIELSKQMGDMPTMDSIDWADDEKLKAMDAEAEGLRKDCKDLEMGVVQVDNADTERKGEIKAQIAAVDEQMGVARMVDRQNEDVAKKEAEIDDMTQNLANMEREADVLNQMRKAVDAEIQRRCDLHFRFVKWKLSEVQINGGETATCYAMANGVRYSDQNSAMKVNMGLDVINALCRHYGVEAPIFIDNAEGVNELETAESQIVRLVVTEDRPLVVRVNE